MERLVYQYPVDEFSQSDSRSSNDLDRFLNSLVNYELNYEHIHNIQIYLLVRVRANNTLEYAAVHYTSKEQIQTPRTNRLFSIRNI